MVTDLGEDVGDLSAWTAQFARRASGGLERTLYEPQNRLQARVGFGAACTHEMIDFERAMYQAFPGVGIAGLIIHTEK